ncbi:glutathione S-transferase family protein [Muricoccus radiodurans]|uniref:glutathione S-transferase family protein n=1 Tax=Muricoccus radiodurans TaxID=2231721 RepID=UPI003CF97006
MLTIWGRTNSSNVMKVLWGCEELGVAFERLDAGGAFGRTRDAEYVAMNPNSLVPTIVEEDGFTLWESHAILRYLCATRPAGEALYPADPKRRAKVDQWMDWTLAHVTTPMTTVFFTYVRIPEPERDLKAADRAAKELGRLWGIVEKELEARAFVCGDFSIADIALGIYLHRWHLLPVERPSLPRVSAWYARLRERPGFRKHLDLPMT